MQLGCGLANEASADDVTADNLRKLSKELQKTFYEHETREIKRLGMMLGYAASEHCLSRELVGYFAEHIEPCGNCGICQENTPSIIQPAQTTPIGEVKLTGFEQLVKEYPHALGRPRQMAHFLCGMNSPAVSADKSCAAILSSLA